MELGSLLNKMKTNFVDQDRKEQKPALRRFFKIIY